MSVLINSDEEPQECPLCLELFELDDLNFYPCSCGYQICRFCWNKIRTEGSGLCPACRSPYSENPADFKPLSAEELARIKAEKRQKDLAKKQRVSENRRHLANVRVVQQNLVFVIGLSERLADADVLKKPEYFGKFGRIHKVVINHSTSYAGTQTQGPSASAYVTYLKWEDALRAIQSVNNIFIDGRTIKASLGTTKYCSHFLKNQICPKTDCMYLHELGDEAASFTKEEMQQGKHNEYEKALHEAMTAVNENQGQSNNYQSNLGDGSSRNHNTTSNGWKKEMSSNKSINQCPSPSDQANIREQRKTQNKKAEINEKNVTSSEGKSHPVNKNSNGVLPHSTNGRHVDPVVEEEEEEEIALHNVHHEDTALSERDSATVKATSNCQPKILEEEDDDLGFDPFHETQKALAEMLESESQTQENNSPLTVNNDDQPIYMSSSNRVERAKTKPVPPPGFGMACVNYENSTHQQRFSNELLNCAPPPAMGSKINSEPLFSHAMLNGISGNAGSMHSKDWQDGLRALLPNVNVSFGNNDANNHHMEQRRMLQANENNSRFMQHRVQEGWNSGNDWTFLDPAIVSSQLASSNDIGLGWRERPLSGHASVPSMQQSQNLGRFFPNLPEFENSRTPLSNIPFRQPQHQNLWGEGMATPPGFGGMNRPFLSNSFQQMSIGGLDKSQTGAREQNNVALQFQRLAPS